MAVAGHLPLEQCPSGRFLAPIAAVLFLLLALFQAGCGDDDPGNQNQQNNNTNALCGDGLVEGGEECDDGAANSDIAPDACRTSCRLHFCGDLVVDTGEACDDGNQTLGDGCTNDCLSNETCGNAVVDEHRGEQCDDGNTVPGDGCGPSCLVERCGNYYIDEGETCDSGDFVSHDGCSSACAEEIDAWWEQQEINTQPLPRRDAAMAYDRTRDVLVLFGGETASATTSGDTWEHDGAEWIQRTLVPSPSPRSDAHMAYDELREVLVLFGGDVVGPAPDLSNETWEYDSGAWVNVTPQLGTSPPATARGAMVYDSNRQVMVLFGGMQRPALQLVASSETWEYDGTTWTPVVTLATPSARADHAMAYDRSRHMTVLFGGRTDATNPTYLPDTWEYGGTTWTNRTTTGGPSARSDHLLAYDDWRGRIVLFGGYCGHVTDCSWSDTLSWNGTDWTSLSPDLSPLARWSMAWAYSSLARGIVLFGGFGREGVGSSAYYDDLWILRHDTNPPSPAEVCTSGTDEDGDELVDCEDPDCEGLPCATGRCLSGLCE